MDMTRESPLLPPSAIEAVLGGHHVRGLASERAHILIDRFCGRPVAGIAPARHKSVSAVPQDLQAIHHAVFDPIGLQPDPFLLAWWVTLHRDCCLGAAFSAAEKTVPATG
jgi:hypothetical protein